MGIIEKQIASVTDEARRYWTGTSWVFTTTTVDYLAAGWFSSSYSQFGSLFRFLDITIPKGSTITAAYLELKCDISRSPTTETRISCQAADNAAAFSNETDYLTRSWTSKVDWQVGAWTADQWYQTRDFAAQVQAVIDRAGWASGNALVVSWDDFDGRSSTAEANHKRGYSYYISSVNAAKLYIEYTAPAPEVTTQAATVVGNAATLNGTVTDDGGETVDYVGFVYGKVSGADPGDVDPATTPGNYTAYWKSDEGDYGENPFASSQITGLDIATWYCRACAHNAYGWAYGDEVSFVTLATHRISNANTSGVQKGGVPVHGASIYILDLITESIAKVLTNEDGMFEHDGYSTADAIPKLCAFIVTDDKATLATSQGSNKDLVFTAKTTDADHWYPGEAGNAITITYADTGSLSVSVTGAAITININAGTTTAAQIKTAIENDADANDMVSVAYAQGQDGSGTPAAMEATNLTGGQYYSDLAHTYITPTEIV